MDPGLLFLPWLAPPLGDDASSLRFPGAITPIVVPVEVLTPAAGAAAAQAWPGLPVARRVSWLLAAGDEPAAAAAVRAVPGPWPADLLPVLRTWAARAQADLGLPAAGRPVQVVGGTLTEATLAYDDTLRLLDLPVRWVGPLVVVVGNQPLPGLPPGETAWARPVCPLLRFPEPPSAQRATIARRLTTLVLALQAPPPGGWPPWLVQGLAQVVSATAGGQGPGPKAMLDRRAAAGLTALRATLEAPAEAVDPRLAEALATALLVPWRRGALPGVLDRLRTGASSEAAIAGATGATLADLCAQR